MAKKETASTKSTAKKPAKKPATKTATKAVAKPAKKVAEKTNEPLRTIDGAYLPATKSLQLSINSKNYSRKATKEEATEITKKIELYNKTPNTSKAKEKLEKDVIAFMEAKTTKVVEEKAKKAVAKKAVAKQIKKVAKKSEKLEADLVQSLEQRFSEGKVSDEEMKKLQELIKKNTKATEIVKPVTSYTPRRGEH